MIKTIFLFGSLLILLSLAVGSFILAEKVTPEETVRKYWQYLLDKNCEKIDEMQTQSLGYRRDANGHIYQVKIETKAVGMENKNISRCYVADEIELFGSKYFRVVKSDVDDELRSATVTVLTRDKKKNNRKYEFGLSKDIKDNVWRIVGFNLITDEPKE